MIKLFVTTSLLLGLASVAAPPAGAADCGVIALLSPCQPTPAPPATPLELPLALPTPQPEASPPPPAAPAAVAPAPAAAPKGLLADAAERILQLVNQERASAGLQALAASPRIATIAAGHSTAMAARGDIWHNDTYFSAANKRTLSARGLGENVAMNGTIDDAHRRLMASPGHRANILRADFDAVGMAVVADGRGMLFVTQDFVDWQGEPGAVGAVAAAKPVAPVRRQVQPVVARKAPAAASPSLPAIAPIPVAAAAAAPPVFVTASAPSSDVPGVPTGQPATTPFLMIALASFALATVVAAGIRLGVAALARG